MFRFVFAILTGLFGAALLHIVIILSLPHFSDRDAYTRVSDEGDENHFYMLDDKDDGRGFPTPIPISGPPSAHSTSRTPLST
jgi:uncharacterized membrane protein